MHEYPRCSWILEWNKSRLKIAEVYVCVD
jgi:hypothetical protein